MGRRLTLIAGSATAGSGTGVATGSDRPAILTATACSPNSVGGNSGWDANPASRLAASSPLPSPPPPPAAYRGMAHSSPAAAVPVAPLSGANMAPVVAGSGVTLDMVEVTAHSHMVPSQEMSPEHRPQQPRAESLSEDGGEHASRRHSSGDSSGGSGDGESVAHSSLGSRRLGRRKGIKSHGGNTAALEEFFMRHLRNPYPNTAEKDALAAQSGMSATQLNVWFVNRRLRYKKRLQAGRVAAPSGVTSMVRSASVAIPHLRLSFRVDYHCLPPALWKTAGRLTQDCSSETFGP